MKNHRLGETVKVLPFVTNLLRREAMFKHKFLFNSLIVGLLLFSFSLDVAAQGINPPPDDPGVSPDGESGTGIAVETEIQSVSWAFTGGPSYDSGWIALQPDSAQTLSHDLGGDVDEYVVDMQYRDSGFNGVNQRNYGGADIGQKPSRGVNTNDRVGAYWRSLTT